MSSLIIIYLSCSVNNYHYNCPLVFTIKCMRNFQHSNEPWSWLAWENNRRFAKSPLEPSQSNVWVTNAENPYWWLVITQILVVLLIQLERKFQPIRSTNWVVTRHQYGIFALVTRTSFCEGSRADLAKRRLFSQAANPYNTTIWLCLKTVQLSQAVCEESYVYLIYQNRILFSVADTLTKNSGRVAEVFLSFLDTYIYNRVP